MLLKEDAEAEQRQLIGPNYEFTWLQLPKTVKNRHKGSKVMPICETS